MKLNRIKTSLVICSLIVATGIICFRSALKYLFSKPTRPWVDKTIHAWSDYIIHKTHIQVEVINPHHTEPKPGKATILMCNHSSAYDIPLSFKAFPNHSIRMLAKKELSKIPIMGKGMTAAEFPFIDRKNRVQAIKDLAYARALMESGVMLWIAPEGTRSKDGTIAPFKKGGFIAAIEAKADIIPMGIRGANNILPARSYNLHLNQTAELHIGEAIDASLFTFDNKDELIAKTFKAIQELSGQSDTAS